MQAATHGPHLDTEFSCHQKVTFLLFKSSLIPPILSLLGLMYKTQGFTTGGWGAHFQRGRLCVWDLLLPQRDRVQLDANVAICTGHSEAAGQTCGHVLLFCLLGDAVAKQRTQPVGLKLK